MATSLLVTACSARFVVDFPPDAALGGDAGDAGLSPPFRVFVTNTTYDGKLGPGGFVGADDACRQAATKLSRVTPARRWIAYLTVGGQHPGARFADPPGGWVRVDGAPVFGSRADVVSGRLPSNPISLTEIGAPAPITDRVWTGMAANNSPSRDTCDGWESLAAASVGRVGNATRRDETWQNDNNHLCNIESHVYCFEQPGP